MARIARARYLHRDHLRSVVLITDEAGCTVEERAIDAWGSAVSKGSLNPSPFSTGIRDALTTTRDFTDEMLDHLGLINVNGQVHDPDVGRFLSADPFVQFPYSTQGRYAEVNNNPLIATDPIGRFLTLFVAVIAKKMAWGVGKRGRSTPYHLRVRQPVECRGKGEQSG